MKNTRKFVVAAGLVCIAVLVLSGCSAAVRKGSSVAFGKKGSTFSISGEEADLSSYRIAQVAPFTSDIGSKSDEVRNKLHEDMIEQLKKSERFTAVHGEGELAPGQPMLLIEGRIIDYEEGSRVRRLATFGGEAFIIVRFTLSDAASGDILAILNSRGFIKDSLAFGGKITDAVDQVNAGVVDFIEDHSGSSD